MNISRREFIGTAAMAGATTLFGGGKDTFIWAYLVHLGMNSWADIKLERWGKKAGFDQVPCGSNWATDQNFGLTVDFAKRNISKEHLKGFLMAPWTRTLNAFRQKDGEAIDLVKAAMKVSTL